MAANQWCRYVAATLAAAPFLVVVACSGSGGGGPLEQCVARVWLSADVPCQCSTNADFLTHPCAEPSCVQNTAYVFLPAGTYREAVIQRSANRFSALGGEAGVNRGAWSVNDGAAPILSQEAEVADGLTRTWATEISCTSARLQREEGPGYRPAPLGLSLALVDASQTGNWSDHPYPP